MRHSTSTRGKALGLLVLAVVWGCGTEPTPPISVPISVTVSPPTISVVTGASQDFSATVANDPAGKGVSWSITGCTGDALVCGSLTNATSASVNYTAPPAVPSGAVGVTATSIADLTKFSTAVVAISAAHTFVGGRIVFQSDRDGDFEIYSMNADGSDVIHLNTGLGSHNTEPAWSPDGKRIAFTSSRNPSHIYTMNVGVSGATLLVWQAMTPAWSRDGTRIAGGKAYTAVCGPRQAPHPCTRWDRIFVAKADGTDLVMLGSGAWPAWSPDGRIAFARSDPYNPNLGGGISVMNADGTGRTNLTDGIDVQPAWSPDGAKIVFVRFLIGVGYDLYMMNADGSGVTQLTHGEGAELGRPAWSPDGIRIAFASYKDGDYEIYVVNADGSSLVQLTHNSARDQWPAWAP